MLTVYQGGCDEKDTLRQLPNDLNRVLMKIYSVKIE